jgi:hypothetical protein
VPGSGVQAVYAYEVLSSTDWAPAGIREPFRPTRFVGIAAQLDRKMRALESYGDEMRPAPHARSVTNARRLAELRGATAGMAAAEAFEIVREICF